MTASKITKGARITGAERSSLQKDICRAYKSGQSIRELAATYSRSYGFVHRIIGEANGVTMRGRGGANRKRGD